MHAIVATVVSLMAVGAASAAEPATMLRVDLRQGSAVRTLTLRCEPASGTLPGAQQACDRLAALPDPSAAAVDQPMCVQGFPSWLSGFSATGRIRGKALAELRARDYQCWGSTSFLGLANALGVLPGQARTAPRATSRRAPARAQR